MSSYQSEKVGVSFIKIDELKDYIIKCSKCRKDINTIEEGYVRYHGNNMCYECANKEIDND